MRLNLVILEGKIGLAQDLEMPIVDGGPAPTRKVRIKRIDRGQENDQQVNAAKSRDPNLAEESRDRKVQITGTLVQRGEDPDRRSETPDRKSETPSRSLEGGETLGKRSRAAATRVTTLEVAVVREEIGAGRRDKRTDVKRK